MNPSQIAAGGAGASGAGAVLNAFGALKEGGANAASFKYQAGIAQVNKKIALQNADYTRAAGEVEATKSGLASRFQMGKITAAQGGSGLDLNSGSPSAVRSSQQRIAQMDQGIIRSNAAHKAWGYDVEAAKEEAQTGLFNRGAKNALEAGNIKAIGSILGGISSVSSKWAQASKYGIGSSSDTAEDHDPSLDS